MTWLFLCAFVLALLGTPPPSQATSFQLWASSTTLRSPAGADELKTVSRPNGTETNRTYDQAGRLASITVSQGAVTVSQRVYTFDRNGNRLTQVEKNGGAEETSTYEYDLDNRLVKVLGPDQTETYTIDAAGNRKTEVVKNLANVVLANKVYSYNSREQLLSVADGSNTTAYLYDGNGNQTSVKVRAAAPTLYTWGPRDQLASLSTGEAFEYDSAGHRTAKTAGGNRTLYVWMGDALVAETNTIGNSLSQVTRVGSLLLGEVRNGTAQHLDQDAFNSVIVTTLSDGTIPGRLSYRAFGQVRSLTGNVATPFRFNGYVSDGGDELSSPSRYFSVATGRFTSMDPVAPTQMDPLSWNAYVGLGANPMVNLDPTGRCYDGSVFCNLGWGLAYAKNDEQRGAAIESSVNQSPALGRSYGALKGASQLVMAPINVGTDAVDAMFGDTQARTRTAQRLVALSQESEANGRSLILGTNGPALRLTAKFVGGVATHAGEMSEAIEQRNYVGQGQAGFDLGMDTLVVAGGATIGIRALRVSSVGGTTAGAGISAVELPLAQRAEIVAAQDARLNRIATGIEPVVVVEEAGGASKLAVGVVDQYGASKKVTGDGTIDRDHQPSKAALLARAEELKGDALTSAEKARIINGGLTVTVPRVVHAAGPTYKGRNTRLQIDGDKANLASAAARDADAMVVNAKLLSPKSVNSLNNAALQIKQRTNAEHDVWLSNQFD